MLLKALERLYVLFRFVFSIAFRRKPLRMVILICTTVAFYFFKKHIFLSAKISQFDKFILCSAFLLNNLEDAVLRFIMIPIRTTVVNVVRKRYTFNVLANRPKEYNDKDYGADFSKLKRIANVITRIDVEVRDLLLSGPILFSTVIALLSSVKGWVYGIILLINIISSIVFTKKYLNKRFATSAADNVLGIEIVDAFRGHSFIAHSEVNRRKIEEAFDEESNLFTSVITVRSKYHILTNCMNLIFGGICYYIFQDQFPIIQYFVFARYYLIFAISIAAILTIPPDGLSLQELGMTKQPRVKYSDDIIINNIELTGLFKTGLLIIKAGSKLVMYGKNGIGKTILARLIARYHKPTIGAITSPKEMILLDATNSLSESDIKIAKEILPGYSYVLERSKISTGYQNFFKIAICCKMGIDLLIFDETLDLLSTTLINEAHRMIMDSKSTILVISHRPEIIAKFPQRLTIADQTVKVIHV